MSQWTSAVALTCAVLCVLDLVGLLPHGQGSPAGSSADELELCALAGVGSDDAAGGLGGLKEGKWCPPASRGEALAKYRGSVLCALASEGFQARGRWRRAGCALKHGLSLLDDQIRVGASSLPGTFRALKSRMEAQGLPAGGEQVLESMVVPGGIFAAEAARLADGRRGATSAAPAADGGGADEVVAEAERMPLVRYIVETLFLYGLLFLLVTLLSCCRCCGAEHQLADKSLPWSAPASLFSNAVGAENGMLQRGLSWLKGEASRRPLRRKRTLDDLRAELSVPAFYCVDLPSEQKRLKVGLGWDTDNGRVDLDVAAVTFDASGQKELNAVYFKNPRAPGLSHSGDNITGEGDGDDEIIDVNLEELPDQAQQIFLCVNAYSKDGKVSFKDVPGTYCRVLDSDNDDEELARYNITKSGNGAGVIIARLYKHEDHWAVQFIGKFSKGTLWRKCVDDMKLIHPLAPSSLAPSGLKSRAYTTDLYTSVRKVDVALGWDTTFGEADLDVSAVLFDDSGVDEMHAIYFNNKKAPGIEHSGDNLTGEGDGADETIMVDFDKLPKKCTQIFFCVNVYNPPGVSFRDVAGAFCRIIDRETQDVLAEYKLEETEDTSGLVIARMMKDEASWRFQQIGKFCEGKGWRDVLPELQQLRAALNDGDASDAADVSYPAGKRRRIA
eukprot:TRINITY_DN71782_c0_g1_i1.p1 TRINITY_DN71782_c0_g1~~TRINITY_DN71782_c0_g1_i1.p1  ORF type:complete len:708 (+),score=156.54 TRINITY_DN71782_c0_g1_i1:114-2126(+)